MLCVIIHKNYINDQSHIKVAKVAPEIGDDHRDVLSFWKAGTLNLDGKK